MAMVPHGYWWDYGYSVPSCGFGGNIAEIHRRYTNAGEVSIFRVGFGGNGNAIYNQINDFC